ncbi:nicotinate (nicotinamide) nucleotide adenylyltransferase [Candidatus Gottesmanbacteria bacterium RBG_16_38_7b]|uniref:Probable nicotinate-nucleotide adenylyltransferase n=1 Tax=Candidatus Gottesmanbacteria bacterium RBG_16_38_7b TaxID=1798372 RepID=A0A1F5YKY1_9BACT|nr:MAG: nicotinate (nicotinamide) nucleotide adenylyltransferase [Candidatus Gottesmanbacteria bacterium RBG_16_38_7b]
MNIAILGGRFDPPHIWHYWTAQQVLENTKGIDQVWYMPDYQNYFKNIVASADDRLEMLKSMETGRIRISLIGIVQPTITYTVSIVSELIKNTADRFFWIVGSDILNEFSRWRDYQKLSRLISFLVFPRKDFPIKHLPAGFIRIEGNLMLSNVSSTIVRDRVRKGLTIAGLVFPEVEEYIRRKNLYK